MLTMVQGRVPPSYLCYQHKLELQVIKFKDKIKLGFKKVGFYGPSLIKDSKMLTFFVLRLLTVSLWYLVEAMSPNYQRIPLFNFILYMFIFQHVSMSVHFHMKLSVTTCLFSAALKSTSNIWVLICSSQPEEVEDTREEQLHSVIKSLSKYKWKNVTYQ